MTGSDLEERLIGVWRLESLKRFRDGAFNRFTMGEDAVGRLSYSRKGFVSAFLASATWGAGVVGPVWETFLAYSGRWDLEGTTVNHLVDIASVPELIGINLQRYVSWSADGDLILTTDGHITAGGVKTHDRLVWIREIGSSV